MTDLFLSYKDYLEKQLEACQKNIWFLQIEVRLLEREKMSVGQTKLTDIENLLTRQKSQIDFWEKRSALLKDLYKENFKEDIKIKTK